MISNKTEVQQIYLKMSKESKSHRPDGLQQHQWNW